MIGGGCRLTSLCASGEKGKDRQEGRRRQDGEVTVSRKAPVPHRFPSKTTIWLGCHFHHLRPEFRGDRFLLAVSVCVLVIRLTGDAVGGSPSAGFSHKPHVSHTSATRMAVQADSFLANMPQDRPLIGASINRSSKHLHEAEREERTSSGEKATRALTVDLTSPKPAQPHQTPSSPLLLPSSPPLPSPYEPF